MTRGKPLFLFATLPCVLAISGCVVGPDYRAPAPSALGVPRGFSVPVVAGAPGNQARWWNAFGDPLLSRLESDGLAANLDMAMARARLRQSRELLIQARSAALPTVSATASYTRTQAIVGNGAGYAGVGGGTLTGNSLSLAADAAYQVDLFGSRSRNIEAARADSDSSRFDYGAVTLTIQSDIATAYLQVRLEQALLANAVLAQTNQTDNLQIAGWRNQAGLIGSLDVEAARSQLAQTEAVIPQIETSLNTAKARLGVLLGRDPGALKADLAAPAPIPTGPDSLGVGIPADLMRQRPDIRAAERSLAAATARIGVAQAALYPALSLGGSIGARSTAFASLFNTVTGQAFASIAQTIFDGGRLRSVVRGQRAATEGAFASYKQTVLIALEDTENAEVALGSAQQRQAQYAVALDAATTSAGLARAQYRSGLIDYAALLITEDLLITARNGAVQARYDRAAATVQLYAALGGGWTDQDTVSGQDK